MLKRECQRLGLPIVTTHELRKTFASLMENEYEAPRRVVAALLGHGVSNVTDGYSHTFTSQLTKWMLGYYSQVSTSCTTNFCRTEVERAGSVEPKVENWLADKDSNLDSYHQKVESYH